MPSGREALIGLLGEARGLARAGDLHAARLACAEAIFTQQPLLAGDRPLLAATVAALLQARGFRLLERLLETVDGRRFRFAGTARLDGGCSVAIDGDGTIRVVAGEALLATETGIDRLSRELAALVR